MTRIKLVDLTVGLEPGLIPAIFSLKFKESNIANSATYEAVELAYRTERPLEIEQHFADGRVEAISHKVKFRVVKERIITFTLENLEYLLTPSDSAE